MEKKGSILHPTYIHDGQIIAPKKYSTSSNVAAKRNANQRCVHATRPGFLAQTSANAKTKETANPFNAQHETSKSDKSCFWSFEFLTNDCILYVPKLQLYSNSNFR